MGEQTVPAEWLSCMRIEPGREAHSAIRGVFAVPPFHLKSAQLQKSDELQGFTSAREAHPMSSPSMKRNEGRAECSATLREANVAARSRIFGIRRILLARLGGYYLLGGDFGACLGSFFFLYMMWPGFVPLGCAMRLRLTRLGLCLLQGVHIRATCVGAPL